MVKRNLFPKCTAIAVIFLLVLFSGTGAIAQGKGGIAGRVLNEAGKGLPEVYVKIARAGLSCISDSLGRFRMENVPAGTYVVSFEHLAYRTKEIGGVPVMAGQTTDMSGISLIPALHRVEPVLITATRSQRSSFEITASVNRVPESLIAERSSKTSAEVLREENVFVQKTNHGGGSAIIRGLSSNQILLLVDGIRLNNSLYRLGNHQYLTTVDINALESLEVVRGPSSCLYGSDAMGGVIQLFTPDLWTGIPSGRWHVNAFSRYASADQEKTGRVEASLQTGQWAFLGGFTFKDYDDLKRGLNSDFQRLEKSPHVQSPSGFSALDSDLKIGYLFESGLKAILAYQGSRQYDVPRFDQYENNAYYRWIYAPQERDLFYFRLEKETEALLLDKITSTMSVHRQEEGREMQKTPESVLTRERDRAWSIGMTVQAQGATENHLLTYGAEFYSDDVYSKRSTLDPATGENNEDLFARYPDGALYGSIGVYLQDEWQALSRLRITPGFRYNYNYSSFELPDSVFSQMDQNFQAMTFNLSAAYSINPFVNIVANAGQAFRAPNLSDLAKFGASKGNIYEVPNPDLKPERLLSTELGIKVNTERLTAEAAVYYASIYDLLASAPAVHNGKDTLLIGGEVFEVKSKQNLGRGYIQGVEANLRFVLMDGLSTGMNLTYTYGQNITANEPVGGIPPLFGFAGLRWDRPFSFAETYVRFAGWQRRLSADDRDDPRIPEGGTPGWHTFNIRGGWKINPNLSVQSAVENILDYNYREHGSGINGPGRSFIVTIRFDL